MKILNLLVFILILGACARKTADKDISPLKVIFDTDLGPDYDDVGALAFLHAMADSGKVEILATFSSNRNRLVVPSIDVINTYFGRPDLPLGAPHSTAPDLSSPYHWADSIIMKYPHSVDSTDMAEDAVAMYRRILNTQPDKSVTIITTGFLTNLRNLLLSKPDSISKLPGKDLVLKKIKNLVSMGGQFPQGKEYNLYVDSVASEYVYRNWPGEIFFTGFETGAQILTGRRLVNSGIKNSPVKDAFRISMTQSEADSAGRMSWDQTAVLIAVYGTSRFFETAKGTIIVQKDGSNRWKNDMGNHRYVILNTSPEEIASFIEERMMHQPAGK